MIGVIKRFERGGEEEESMREGMRKRRRNDGDRRGIPENISKALGARKEKGDAAERASGADS